MRSSCRTISYAGLSRRGQPNLRLQARFKMRPEVQLSREVSRAVRAVALANLAYFGIEFAVATSIGSVSLFADSVDFLEDAAVNGLILLGLSWSQRERARLGMALALI